MKPKSILLYACLAASITLFFATVHLLTNRFSIVTGRGEILKIDRLTGKSWIMYDTAGDQGWKPIYQGAHADLEMIPSK